MRGIIYLILILWCCNASAQNIIFQKKYGSTASPGNSDLGESVQQTADGGYAIAGYSDSFGNGTFDFYLIKTNNIGDTIWTKVYGTINEDAAYEIQETVDGGYIVVGYSDNVSTDDNIVLFKTYSNGSLQWYKTYIGTNAEAGFSVRPTTDGGYILLGTVSVASPFNYYMHLIKTDFNGDTLWTKNYGIYTEGYSVRQTSDGGYILTGRIYNAASVQDVHLIKTDSNGDTLWTRTYGGTKNDQGNSVQQTTDGGYIITGSTKSFDTTIQNGQAYLIKTDSNGDTLWTKKISNPNCLGALGNSVQQTLDGGYIIGGTHGYVGQQYDMYLVKTNSSGDTLWTRTYGGVYAEGGNSVQQTTDKGYIVVGFSQSNGFFYDVYLVKTDSLGNTSPLVGVEEQEQNITQQEITIYPNPFAEQANLVLPDEIETNGEAELVIYDVLGNETERVKVTAQRALIQRDNLKEGMYFCKVIKENTVIATGKFIISE